MRQDLLKILKDLNQGLSESFKSLFCCEQVECLLFFQILHGLTKHTIIHEFEKIFLKLFFWLLFAYEYWSMYASLEKQ